MQIRQASILRKNWMLKAFVFIAAITVGTGAGYLYSIGLKTNSPVVHSSDNVSANAVQSNDEANDSIKQTVDKLRRFKSDVMNPNIPVAAKPLLTLLKHQLRDLITGTLNARSNSQQNPQGLRANIINELKSDGVTVEEPKDEVVDENYLETDYVYGDIYDIAIERPATHPDLIVGMTTVGVCCGKDTSFYIFKNNGTQWELVLAQEANDYDEISDAHGRFQYAISPPDNRNDFFVVTANVNPWCTSNWQQIRYEVLRLGRSADKPERVLSGKDTIYLGVDPPEYQLSTSTQGFSLSFASYEFMNRMNKGAADPVNEKDIRRSHVVTYRINGSHATLISKRNKWYY